LWAAAKDRGAVTEAANAIDQALRNDPDTLGESRPEGTRVLLVPPLGILFQVDNQDLKANVLSVWRYRKRAQGP
jgi:hypothetical protein